MKLDSRILKGKKPLDCFDVEEAKQFIGKKGYFCDHRSGFTNISNLVEDVLRDITPDDNYCEVYKTNCTSWEYFLPEEWIKEPEEKPEKKYRPYTMSEFKSEFKINIILTLRKRNEDKYVYQTVYLGNRHYDDTDSDENFIYLSHGTYSLKELFEKFEIVRNGDWQPFGVLEDD